MLQKIVYKIFCLKTSRFTLSRGRQSDSKLSDENTDDIAATGKKKRFAKKSKNCVSRSKQLYFTRSINNQRIFRSMPYRNSCFAIQISHLEESWANKHWSRIQQQRCLIGISQQLTKNNEQWGWVKKFWLGNPILELDLLNERDTWCVLMIKSDESSWVDDERQRRRRSSYRRSKTSRRESQTPAFEKISHIKIGVGAATYF